MNKQEGGSSRNANKVMGEMKFPGGATGPKTDLPGFEIRADVSLW